MMSSGVPVYQQSMQQLDQNELHVCPYDSSHRVASKRFVRHIIKCRKNHAGAEKVLLCFLILCLAQCTNTILHM